MTYITPLTGRSSVYRYRFLTMILAGCALLLLQSSGVQAQQWATNGTNINNTNSGNVGVGTASPAAPLEVRKDQNASTDIYVNNATAGSGTGAYTGLRFFQGTTLKALVGSANSGSTGYTGGANALQLWNAQNAPIVFGTNSLERLRIDASGNVGIGFSAPGFPLEVRGNSINIGTGAAARALIGNYDLTSMAQGVGGGLQFGGKYNSGGTIAGFASISGIKENATDNDFSSALVFTTRSMPNPQTEKMRISSTGNVGIGTSTPLYSLDVNGGTNGFRAKAASSSSNDTIATFESAAGIQAIVRANGYFGIGTASPASLLQVGSSSSSGNQYLTIDAAAGYQSAMDFRSAGVQKWVIYRPASSSDLKFYDGTDRLVLQSGGNVGIGISNPTSKLDVNGNTNVTGNLNVTATITGGNIVAKYQDVAEWVPSSQQLSAGTVVVLDHTKSNQVIASSQAYDTRVAGVISLQPGITLGENGAGKVLVATTGRVKVKVDATAGPIQVGDLLVTSDKEGVAKKSDPLSLGGVELHRPGTLIGKALEPLAKGTGEILVLLSLQ